MPYEVVRFSVIIPTRNRPEALANCLQSFLELEYPAGYWELIVVNDGGQRSFTAVSPALQHALPLRLFTQPAAGPAAARNKGAQAARFDHLAFTDDDCCVTPQWLHHLAQGFAETGADGLGGQTLNPQQDRTGMLAAQFLNDFLYLFMRDERGNALLLISNNAALRREVFDAVGGFDETYRLAAAEDLELSTRVVREGFRLRYYPAAQVWHHHQLTGWGHVRQQFRYGRGGHQFYKAQRQLPPIVGPTTRQFYLLLFRQLRQSNLPLASRWLVLVAQLAYRLGILYERFINLSYSS